MTQTPKNVFILCTGNACRGILAGSILNRVGRGRLRGYNAGSEAETEACFAEVYGQIERCISIFVSLPFDALDRLNLKRRLDELGRNLPQSA